VHIYEGLESFREPILNIGVNQMSTNATKHDQRALQVNPVPLRFSHLHEPALSSKSQVGVFAKMTAHHRYSGKTFSKVDSKDRRSKWLAFGSLILALCVLIVYLLQKMGVIG
jgi:hypothetical protein